MLFYLQKNFLIKSFKCHWFIKLLLLSIFKDFIANIDFALAIITIQVKKFLRERNKYAQKSKLTISAVTPRTTLRGFCDDYI